MDAVRWVAFAIGIGVVGLSVSSLIKMLVVPRGFASRLQIVVERTVRRAFLVVANRFDDYERKDRVLAFLGPIALVAMLAAWLLMLFVGFALMLWPLVPDGSLAEALRESGSAMLTLGFAPPSTGAVPVHLLAGASGLVVVALLIAYLPTLYGSFNRRETMVTLLQSRAGAPAWGPEILARHELVNLHDRLPDLYAEWERWAADVAESHTNYPTLIAFRSPHPLRSWIVALLAVLDAAAMHLALCPRSAPTEARLCLRMGFICLRSLADAVRIPYDPDPFPEDPIELTFEEFEGGVKRTLEAGFRTERSTEEAWPHFRGWRVNYEAVAYALADWVVAPPGPWTGDRSHLPGMAIVPQRPADRKPDDALADRPKATSGEWRA
ncbi:MAG TPA: hypothetical protein VHJ34_05535 [Actinomycetota bacterium]|nr:hypothetical protein [Actinomycetota bacterium]